MELHKEGKRPARFEEEVVATLQKIAVGKKMDVNVTITMLVLSWQN